VAGVGVTAKELVQVSTGITGPAPDAGGANPGGHFRYDCTLGPSGGYIYNLATAGLTTGTYELRFSVTSDPFDHAVRFQVK
jgi:hypothetical protein